MPEDRLKEDWLSKQLFVNLYSRQEDDLPSETCLHEDAYFSPREEYHEVFLLCPNCGDLYNLSLINRKLGHESLGDTMGWASNASLLVSYVKGESCQKKN